MQKLILLVVKTYRTYKKYFSLPLFMLGFSHCRFYPTCSVYCFLAIKKYGTLQGLVLTLKRLSRCQPFGGAGMDFPKV